MNRRNSAVRVAIAVLVFAGALAVPTSAWGAFSAARTNGTSNLTAGTLLPPTNLHVAFHCALLGVLRPVADLTWTATPSTATGYVLDRYQGAVLQNTTTISGTATTAYSDGLGPLTLGLSTTYTWHLRTFLGSWVSGDAVTSASTPAICT